MPSIGNGKALLEARWKKVEILFAKCQESSEDFFGSCDLLDTAHVELDYLAAWPSCDLLNTKDLKHDLPGSVTLDEVASVLRMPFEHV